MEDGIITCSQDLFEEHYRVMFEGWDKLPPEKLRMNLLSSSTKICDMWHRYAYKCPETEQRTQFCCTYNPMIEFNPMTKSEAVLPDPVQTKISEKMLGRGLTEEEYYGIIKVPLISPKGLKYWGQVDQYVFPRDYKTKYKSGITSIDFKPIPVIFIWEDLYEKEDTDT